MRILTGTLLSLVMLSGCTIHCTDGGLPGEDTCINASSITEVSCCTGTTVYDLDPAFPLGDTITLNGIHYNNAVQIAGTYEGDMKIQIREFDQDMDADKKSITCNCFAVEAWDRLPIYVVVQNCNSFQE
jgi:hypothetical protein